MTGSARSKRYFSEGAGVGLVRVEVLVPPAAREVILAEAARLRAEHRQADAWNERLELLYSEAVDKFGPRCLWNIKPLKTLDGMRVIADHLRKHAGMDAWRLAAKITEEITVAAR
jgi:hypothetical protein